MSQTDPDQKSDEQYSYEMEQIYNMFPNAKFDIAIQLEDLHEVVTDNKEVVIKNTYSCYCYDDCNRNTDYFYITAKNGCKMTNKFIIQELINQGLSLDCNHRFLEGFMKSKNSDCQFEIVVGS